MLSELLGHLRAATATLLAEPGPRVPLLALQALEAQEVVEELGVVPDYIEPGALAEHLDWAAHAAASCSGELPLIVHATIDELRDQVLGHEHG